MFWNGTLCCHKNNFKNIRLLQPIFPSICDTSSTVLKFSSIILIFFLLSLRLELLSYSLKSFANVDSIAEQKFYLTSNLLCYFFLSLHKLFQNARSKRWKENVLSNRIQFSLSQVYAYLFLFFFKNLLIKNKRYNNFFKKMYVIHFYNKNIFDH